eukprot:286669-Rhodomonas_salina.7
MMTSSICGGSSLRSQEQAARPSAGPITRWWRGSGTGSLTSRKSKGPTRKGEGRLKWGNENRGQLPYSFK